MWENRPAPPPQALVTLDQVQGSGWGWRPSTGGSQCASVPVEQRDLNTLLQEPPVSISGRVVPARGPAMLNSTRMDSVPCHARGMDLEDTRLVR